MFPLQLRRLWSMALGILIVTGASAGPVTRAQTGQDVPGLRATPFGLGQVRLLDGFIADAMERNRRYLLSLDLDRQLHTFRLNAHLPTSAQPPGGWEHPDHMGRGEFFGHSLSARAQLYALTGDERLRDQLTYLVSELARCQQALGTGGYLHAEPESIFDRLERGDDVQGIYYTVHKLLAGLLDVYTYCGNRQALEIADRLGQWVHARSGRLSQEHWLRVIEVEFGGLNESLYNLYAVTRKPEHLETARRFDHERIYAPLAAGRDELIGLHANTTIPKIIGAARGYELTGNPRLRTIAEFFWHQVALERSYATGGTSNGEFWQTPPGVLASQLGPTTQECCCTYNMLKLTRHVISWTGDPRVADFSERALFNAVLGTQNPQDGMTMYFVPLAGGYWKTYASPLESFWCCTGTGVESFAKLGDSIYFHDDDSLWVNLFIASRVDWAEKGLTLEQHTRFPEQQGTTLRFGLKQPVELTLRLRVPSWAVKGISVRLNEAPLEVHARPSSYLEIKRTWKDGDTLEVEMPMSLHLDPMPDDPNLAAILYGPIVLVGRLDELSNEQRNEHNTSPSGSPCPVPWFTVDDNDLNSWIEPSGSRPLEFRTRGRQTNVTLEPSYSLFGHHYAVYWEIFRTGSPAHRAKLTEVEQRRQLAARTVDTVDIGDAASESAHALSGERTGSGSGNNRHWRHAYDGGWFSYRMKVADDEPMTLQCDFWGSESPPRRFDILVDGTKITTLELNHNQPGRFFTTETDLPAASLRDKKTVEVRFQAHPGNTAGGVFGLRLLRGAPQP